MSSKVEYVARSLSRGTHKKYETFIINEVYSRLNNPNLEIATQQHVVTKNDGTKYIDLYFPQLKIAIEGFQKGLVFYWRKHDSRKNTK